MLSALTTRASRALPRLSASQCHLCRSWQPDPICACCLTTWRHARRRCLRCAIDLPHDRQDTVCQACEDQSPEFDRAIVAVDYGGPWPGMLTRLKFQGATALAKPLGQLLADAVQPRRGATSLIVPVPLSSRRLRERGYNQAWLLARQVGAHLGIPAHPNLLERTHHTQRLMSLSAEDRMLHIKEAFQVNEQHALALRNRHVAIVDDVMTTGATLNACARTLLETGAKSVSAWVVARTPAPGSVA